MDLIAGLALCLFAQDKLRQEYDHKRANASQNPKGQFELGTWCEIKGLREEAIRAYERAIEIDPDYEPARKALGHKFVLGRWASEQNYADPSWWAHPKVDQKKVDEAIVRGVEFLLKQERLPRVRHGARHFRMEELALFAVLESGWDRRDPRVEQLLRNVLKQPLDSTYAVSLRAMALASLDPIKHQQSLAACAQFLVDTQAENGQWGYGKPLASLPSSFRPADKPPIARIDPKLPQIEIRRGKSAADKTGDNSNSQYAALGLRACLSGLVVAPPETLRAALRWWQECQNADGGWGYDDPRLGKLAPDPEKSWGAMTAGAVGALAIYAYTLDRVWVEAKTPDSIPRGTAWLAKNLAFDRHPQQPANVFHYYWIYAVERAGRLLETETFGAKEWYPEGAHYLLARQQPSGAWTPEAWTVPPALAGLFKKEDLIPGAVTETCFAILFLRRATRRLDDTIKSASAR
jgi:hypothetical protein